MVSTIFFIFATFYIIKANYLFPYCLNYKKVKLSDLKYCLHRYFIQFLALKEEK